MSLTKKISVIVFLCLLIPAAWAFGEAEAKVGVVDFQKVIDVSIAGKAVNAELVAFNEKWKARLTDKRKEIEAIQKKIDEDLVMSREQREKLKRDMAKKFVDFKSDEKKYKEDIAVLRNRKLKLLTDDALKLAKKIGQEEGYQVIISKTGTLYYSDAVDITEKMIKIYNEEYARKPAAKKNE
ncbi:conserved exported hypothetical protein [Candidatus Desulfarcum epimagneticum]|uniref:Molecular chaperone Skp n=1 Tax=uncultured Desulfobacteraceae bacterium TaxID=218296 RepID=A0A484HDC6_9BACT|nr:conserved exported hypothetical protein [uncultured Desulfobacteraceae bacterium]